uniref:Tubulin--tyrosine ligase-like protein 9 n=1 Tax=Macrostomum lignano TaxID=282301 RepID=A0A1I8FU28_9PLAT
MSLRLTKKADVDAESEPDSRQPDDEATSATEDDEEDQGEEDDVDDDDNLDDDDDDNDDDDDEEVSAAGELTLEDDLTASVLINAAPVVGEDDDEVTGEGDDEEEEDDDEETASPAPADQSLPKSSNIVKPTPPPLPIVPTPKAAKPSTVVKLAPTEETDRSTKPETPARPVPTGSAKKKKKKKVYTICLTSCKYDVVRRSARRVGFREVEEDDDWNVYWTDTYVTIDKVCAMKKYQKINHFPGMSEICRKDNLSRNLARMQKLFPKEFANIAPKTWILPADWGELQAFARSKKHKTYILKPEASCQGKGIWCTKNAKDIKPGEHQICQLVYVLVTSCDPLRIFVFKEGLARFTTVKYRDPTNGNLENIYMHLTNYAVQKGRKDYVRNDEEGGTKRRISTINRWLENNNHDVAKLWVDIDDIIIKTVMSAHYVVKHNYRTCFPNHVRGSACFEILGFDIILDRKLRPQVLEVNHSPSFSTDSRLDREIKEALITDTLNLINVGAVDRKKVIEEERRKIQDRLFQRNSRKETKEDLEKEAAKYAEIQEAYELQHMGNFRRIYPEPTDQSAQSGRYARFLAQGGFLYQETAATRARADCARQQREELSRKAAGSQLGPTGRQRRVGGTGAGAAARSESPDRPTLRRPQQTRSRVRQQQQQQQGAAGCVREVSESETTVRPRLMSAQSDDRRPVRGAGRLTSARPRTCGGGSGGIAWPDEASTPIVDMLTPQPIIDEEEIDRLSGLMQRDNLVRGLGIVEQVYRLLHCTPGTVASMPVDPQQQQQQQKQQQQQQPYQSSLLAANSRYLDELSNRLGVAMLTGSYAAAAAAAAAATSAAAPSGALQQQQQQQRTAAAQPPARQWMRPGSRHHRLAFGQRVGSDYGSAGKARSY